MTRAARCGVGSRAVLVDGGPLREPPAGLTPESPEGEIAAEVARIVGPSFARLSRTFASEDEYLAFWRAHPSMTEWNDAVVGYVVNDLVPCAGGYRPACRLAAAERDAIDLFNFTGKPEEPLDVPVGFSPRGARHVG